jgi:hypothetical protein
MRGGLSNSGPFAGPDWHFGESDRVSFAKNRVSFVIGLGFFTQFYVGGLG